MKINPNPNVTIRVRRVIHARRERVFAAWTTPEQIVRWLVPRPGRALSAKIDLRSGGSYEYHVSIPGGGEEDLYGVFKEVTPPERLSYTWAHRGNPDPRMNFGEALVTVEFVKVEAGTEVRITHSRLPGAEIGQQFSGGWEAALDQLEEICA